MTDEKRDLLSPFCFVTIDDVGTGFAPSVGCMDTERVGSSHDFQKAVNKQIKGTGRGEVLGKE